MFAGRPGPAPLCVARRRLAGAGRRAAVTAREAHSSVHLGVGLRILLATREISPFSPCLQYGYKSGIFYYFFLLNLGSFFFFFFLLDFFLLFFPLPPVLLLLLLFFDLFNFIIFFFLKKGVHYNRFCSLFSFFFSPSGVCVCRCRCRSPAIYTDSTLFVSPPFGSVEFLC